MTAIWHEERLLIDGALRSAEHDATYPVENPATGGQLGVAADATPADVEAALAAARRAFDESGWAGDVELRVRCLRQLHQALVEHADQLTELTIAEVGAPRSACATVQLTAPTEFLPYYADLAEGYEWTTPLGVADTLGGPAERWTERNPIGVVAAITPWNVPHQINLAKVAPALAAGCTVVLKPRRRRRGAAWPSAGWSPSTPTSRPVCSTSSRRAIPPSASCSPATPGWTWSASPARPPPAAG